MRQIESIKEPADGLLRVHEAAALLGLKPATIRAWLLKRKLPCVRLSARAVRLRRTDIEKIISQGLIAARQ
ncbi:MAG TPA: helix-turn-helix domain-containing protein [Terriglobia bacterium]|nr:helix-turn-helix domain-containing protein [Terriglobia bacterium]